MVRRLRKPLSFSTTMRNPERIAPFLASIVEFEGKTLTNELIRRIIISWIQNRLIKCTTAMNIKPEYYDVYNNEDMSFSFEQAADIYELNEKHTKGHKEAGFDRGWPSRFDTYMSLPKEFGFLFYEMNKPIEISETGHLLVSTLADDDSVKVHETDIFFNALVKFQSNNPFRRNTINNAPFVLFLNTVKALDKLYDWEKRGIYRHEIPFLTCWPNDNADDLALYINDFRLKYGKKPSDEIIYELCLKLLNTTNRTRYKFKQIVSEGVDDFIRKFRITGIISLRGGGYLIDINEYEIEKINYVINEYSSYIEFSDTYDYYLYMGEIDSNIVSTYTSIPDYILEDKKTKMLNIWADNLSFTDLDREIKALERGSRDPVLKYIPGPTRFEFLTSIALVKSFPESKVIPNYTIDDEGMPTNHAQGGMGDIEVFSSKSDVLVEVTLMRNRSQSTNEIPAITRHLSEFAEGKEHTVFSIFVAPSIHPDTKYMIGHTESKYRQTIVPIVSDEFVDTITNVDKIEDMLNYKYIVGNT